MPLCILILAKRKLTAHGRRIFLRLLLYVNVWEAATCIVYKAAKSPGHSNLKDASEPTDVCKSASEIKELIPESFAMYPFREGREAPALFSGSSQQAHRN